MATDYNKIASTQAASRAAEAAVRQIEHIFITLLSPSGGVAPRANSLTKCMPKFTDYAARSDKTTI